jgi:hypothetical protein
MRLTAALLTLACLAACGGVQTLSERSLARDDEWRQRQAELDDFNGIYRPPDALRSKR